MSFRCVACFLKVDEIPKFKEGECRADKYGHRFKKVEVVEGQG